MSVVLVRRGAVFIFEGFISRREGQLCLEMTFPYG